MTNTLQTGKKINATILINSASGKDEKKDAPEKLQAIFDEYGWSTSVKGIDPSVDITQMARDAREGGCNIVVAGGGDGTLNATASALVGTECALGVLPVGTLNHFARDLKIPLDLEGAARVIATGEEIRVDIGEVNGRYFLNNSIIGLYPTYRYVKDREIERGKDRRLAFLWAVLSIFRFNPFLHVRLKADGRWVERTTPYILIANNEHQMEGYRLGERRSLSDGKLWIYVMRRKGRWGLFRMILDLLLGRFSAARDFDVFSARELLVYTRKRRIDVALDGEIERLHTPLRYQIHPQALRVIAPSASSPEQ